MGADECFSYPRKSASSAVKNLLRLRRNERIVAKSTKNTLKSVKIILNLWTYSSVAAKAAPGFLCFVVVAILCQTFMPWDGPRAGWRRIEPQFLHDHPLARRRRRRARRCCRCRRVKHALYGTILT